MRRVILVLVLAVVGAGWYGYSGSRIAFAVNGTSVSQSQFRAELRAFESNPGLFCYMSSLANVALAQRGAGNDTVTAAGETAWANLRVEGIAINQYVAVALKHHPSAAELASATVSLEGELSQAAAQTSNTCAGTPAQALAAMPAELRAAQIEDQASSVYLVSKLNATIPLTATAIKAYYQSHQSRYDRLCVAVAVVSPANVNAFGASQAQGLSVAALAKKYSVDKSAAQGGAYGCFTPASSSYASVRNDVGTTPVGHFPTTPQSITYNGGTYALYVAPTSKSPTPFAQAQGVVISDIQASNATAANSVKASILYAAAIALDPAYGRWGLGSNGPTIFAPGLPPTSGPATTAQLTTASTTPYQ
ncbi:MAG: peptidyl-prolyl cis-trans isomerase [Acidobacteria bacterium]|nr:peptidyl-prolyl cis-trans isomerase [Acidobacteriota bacterium]